MNIKAVAIVGRHGAGKTTLLTGLIPRLRARGYRVGAIKHAHHDFAIDHPGKDSFRLQQAGARAVLISSPAKLAFIKTISVSVLPEPALEDLLSYFDPREFDVVLVEGFHASSIPKIGVSHRADPEELRWLKGLPRLLALVVGEQPGSPAISRVASHVPVYSFDQPDRLIALLERELKLVPRPASGSGAAA